MDRAGDLLRGPDVALRRLRETDLDSFLAYRSDPEVARFQSWDQMDRDRMAAFIAHCASGPLFTPGQWCQIGIARKSDSALIGDLGIHVSADKTEAELGITLSGAAQGKGLGFQAFGLGRDLIFAQTPVARIWAITDARNTPSLRMIARCGFQLDRQETVWDGGENVTEHFFCLPRPSQAM